MYQSGRVGDKAKKHKSPTKSRRVGITRILLLTYARRSLGGTSAGYSLIE